MPEIFYPEFSYKIIGILFNVHRQLGSRYQEKYFLDFLVEDKIIVETKTVNNFSKNDIKQVLGYLYAKNLKLGILVNFRANSLEYKRILNSKYK